MIAVYPGSFDPLTYGHLDIITRASKFVDRLIVAVLNNSSKTPPMFSADSRLAMLEELCRGIGVGGGEGVAVASAKKPKY